MSPAGAEEVSLRIADGSLKGGQPRRRGVALSERCGCLGACDHANIIAGVRGRGPGIADLPDILGLYTFTPPRRVRQTMQT
jgi:hypothetical protein